MVWTNREPETSEIKEAHTRTTPLWIKRRRGEHTTLRKVAERVGFEPTVQFPAHTLSKRAP